MYIGEKRRIHSRSFHHRIKDGGFHYVNPDHFLGLDPMDQSRFHHLYEGETRDQKMFRLPEDDCTHLISNM